jgi:hypothetical protein
MMLVMGSDTSEAPDSTSTHEEGAPSAAQQGASLHQQKMLVAGLADCDPRTAERAIVVGLDAIRPRPVRERIAAAFATLGLRSRT